MNIGIVGGGISGLALATRLADDGHAVTVLERGEQPGGLATWQDHGPFEFDRFYHVILPTDRFLIDFIDHIGLSNRLIWRKTETGFFVDRAIYPLSSSLDFLRFPPLSLLGKARLAFTILYCSRINDWRRLENVTVEDFLLRLSGRSTYEKIWKPLLLAKLGENYRRVSAVFIWTYIKRMFSARDASAGREQMGHVYGGYKTILERIVERIRERKGDVRLGVNVERLQPASSGGGIDVICDGRRERFDKVVFTGPVNVLGKVAPQELVDVAHSGRNVEYLGVQCMALVTRKPLMPYYILNIADDRVPFTGVVGMSSILERDEVSGLHLAYLPKYILSTERELDRPEEDVRRDFLAGIKLIFPDFDQADIVSARVHRAVKVQPLQVLNFSRHIPRTETKHPDFYVLNTAQFVNNTLNNNEVIRAVNAFHERYGASLGRRDEKRAAA